MSFFEIFIIALALAADAFSVAFVIAINGCSTWKHIMRMAFMFGFFQFSMPLIGFILYSHIEQYLGVYNHWVAFILLTGVGFKMLWEGATTHKKEEKQFMEKDPTKGITVLTLAFATSLDALVMGTTFAAQGMSILTPSAIIGIVCFVVTMGGMLLSRLIIQNSSILGSSANAIGGAILIMIGLKILLSQIF